MRLDAQQRSALTYALEPVEGEAYLFGSRTDPDKRGGDVDVLIFSKANAFRLSQKVTARYQMQCEEKIDVVVYDPDAMNPEQRRFVDSLQLVRLK